jgi:hypothetical protein
MALSITEKYKEEMTKVFWKSLRAEFIRLGIGSQGTYEEMPKVWKTGLINAIGKTLEADRIFVETESHK